MTTVTAKQLRSNLSEYLDRLTAGEEIAIIRRSKIIGKLSPAKKTPQGNGAAVAAALDDYKNYLRDNKIVLKTGPDKTTKEIYHELLDKKYGLK